MATLENIRLFNFRNFENEAVETGPGVNFFTGENAQGKTNLIEAVHLVANLQSFRTRRTGDLIRYGEKSAHIRAGACGPYTAAQLGIDLDREGKKALLDGKTPSTAAEYLSVMRTVFFVPQDMEIASGSLQMRRRYADRAAFTENPAHLERLKNHARILKQRNEAIRQRIKDLDAWTIQLADAWHEITKSRIRALDGMAGVIEKTHREISGGREEIELELKGAEKLLQGGKEALLEVLKKEEEEDRKKGFTRRGAHRDRIEIKIGGREIADHASQGQKRTAVLAMKLSLLTWVREKAGDTPIFLLDDPGSELDGTRLGFLGAFISGWPGQTLIATVNPGDIPLDLAGETRHFKVSAGRITKH